MEFTINQIAEMLNGEVIGNPNICINQLTKIEEGREHSLSFLSNPKYKEHLYKTKSSAVIVNKDFIPHQKLNTTLIKVKDAYAAFAQLLRIVDDLQKKKERVLSSHVSLMKQQKLGKIFISEHLHTLVKMSELAKTCVFTLTAI